MIVVAAVVVARATGETGTRPTPPPIPSTRIPAAEPWAGPRGVEGWVEAIPDRVFRATPYNGWPLMDLRVHEGQRLRFRREGGAWVGDSPILFIQAETPAEIDGRREDVEIAELEWKVATRALEVFRAEAARELRAAEIRERNARQQFESLDRLLDRNSTTQIEHRKARNALDIAQLERAQLAETLAARVEGPSLQVELADHRRRRAEVEFQLVDYKRELSWGRLPVGRGRFEEVVVTRVGGVRGEIPSGVARRDAWVEVVDDRLLQIRAHLLPADLDRVAVGQSVPVAQGQRRYDGTVHAIAAVADRDTQRVPILVRVPNHDRRLRLNTRVDLDLADPSPEPSP